MLSHCHTSRPPITNANPKLAPGMSTPAKTKKTKRPPTTKTHLGKGKVSRQCVEVVTAEKRLVVCLDHLEKDAE